MKPNRTPLLVAGAAVLAYLLLGKKATAAPSGTLTLVPSPPPPKATPPGAVGVVAGLPPKPTVGATAVPVYASPSFKPSDDLSPGGIVKAQELTIRQIQESMVILGASQLKVNGCWDIPTQQAVWDFQYVHQKDNPSDPLDVTGEMNQLTQTALQNAVAKAKGISGTFY